MSERLRVFAVGPFKNVFDWCRELAIDADSTVSNGAVKKSEPAESSIIDVKLWTGRPNKSNALTVGSLA